MSPVKLLRTGLDPSKIDESVHYLTRRGFTKDNNLNTAVLRIVHPDKLMELQAQQENLKLLQAELNRIDAKINKQVPPSVEDTKFMGNLGWLTALSVTIASIAASL